MSILQVNDISFAYSDHEALSSISFALEKGEIGVFVGPSGAGKTTLLNLIAGLTKANSGSIQKEENLRLAYVFQDPALYTHVKVKDNIAIGLKKLGYSKQEIDALVKESAKAFHIDDLLNRYPKQLSGGERQRVSLARAFVRKPDLVLMDEPFANLDARLVDEVVDEILSVQKENDTTILMVLHDQRLAMKIADTLFVLKDGKLIGKDSPMNLYNNPQSLEMAQFLGSPQINIFEKEVKEGNITFFEKKYSIQNDVIVGLRAEAIILEAGDEIGTIISCTPYEERYEMKFLCEEGICTTISPKSYMQNEKIKFSIKEENILFFDEETGKRIDVVL